MLGEKKKLLLSELNKREMNLQTYVNSHLFMVKTRSKYMDDILCIFLIFTPVLKG